MPTTTGVTIIGTISEVAQRARMKRHSRSAEQREREPEHRLDRDREGDELRSHPERVAERRGRPAPGGSCRARRRAAAAVAVEARARPDPVQQRVDHDGRARGARRGEQEIRAAAGRARRPGAAARAGRRAACVLAASGVVAPALQVGRDLLRGAVERGAAAGAGVERLVELGAEDLLDLGPVGRARPRLRPRRRAAAAPTGQQPVRLDGLRVREAPAS